MITMTYGQKLWLPEGIIVRFELVKWTETEIDMLPYKITMVATASTKIKKYLHIFCGNNILMVAFEHSVNNK